MNEKELLRALTALLEKCRRPRLSIQKLDNFLHVGKVVDASNKEEMATAIASYVKTVIASQDMQDLLKLLEQEGQLTTLLDVANRINVGAGSGHYQSALRAAWHPELSKIKTQIKDLMKQTEDKRDVLKVMIRELRELKYDEEIEIPDVVLDLPVPHI